MSEMIERVARAACHKWKEREVWKREYPRGPDVMCGIAGHYRCGCGYQDTFMAIARANIEALREPTEAMVQAVDGPSTLVTLPGPLAWPVMIDAALKEPQTA